MITTVIFDIGRVLVFYDWRKFLLEDLGDPEKVELLYDAFFGHGIWDEIDRDVLPEDELVRRFAVYAPGYEEYIRSFIRTFAVKFQQRPYAKDWIRRLKERGLKVYFLSNYSQQAINVNHEVLDFIPLMDGGVFSCHAKLIKPDPAIYRTICEKYGLIPAQCLFVDDKKVNTDAAEDFGMKGLVFRNYEEACAQMEELLADRT